MLDYPRGKPVHSVISCARFAFFVGVVVRLCAARLLLTQLKRGRKSVGRRGCSQQPDNRPQQQSAAADSLPVSTDGRVQSAAKVGLLQDGQAAPVPATP